MAREYKILCTPPKGAALSDVLFSLPSPILRSQMREIYNYRVDDDGFYLIDRATSAVALQVLVDAALATDERIAIVEL